MRDKIHTVRLYFFILLFILVALGAQSAHCVFSADDVEDGQTRRVTPNFVPRIFRSGIESMNPFPKPDFKSLEQIDRYNVNDGVKEKHEFETFLWDGNRLIETTVYDQGKKKWYAKGFCSITLCGR